MSPTAPPRTGMSEVQYAALQWLASLDPGMWGDATNNMKLMVTRALKRRGWIETADRTYCRVARITPAGRAALARASVVDSSAGEGGTGR